MCLSCKSKRTKLWSSYQNRMTGYPIKFDHNEVEELRRKFKKMSGDLEVIDKATFHENMGILGLQSVSGFSDRLFNSFDIDNDKQISFQDFLEYMEVLKCGEERSKAKISFRLIDIKNRNQVSESEFKQFLADYFRSWTSITNSIITPEIKERSDQYVKHIYSKVQKQTKKSTIDFGYYAEKMYSDKEFMDAFQFIAEGVANVFISGNYKQNDSMLLFKVLSKIKKIYSAFGEMENSSCNQMADYQKIFRFSPIKENRESQLYDELEDLPEIFQEHFPQNSLKKTQPKEFFMKGKTRKNIFNKNVRDSPVSQQKTAKNQNSANRTFKINQQINHSRQSSTKQRSQQHRCHSCYNMIVLEKKLDFLAHKLKELIDETESIYNRLYDKFINSAHQANQKKQTVGNIHHTISKDNMIFFGDDNWNLVLNMMIGIQMAVRSVKGYQQMLYQEPADFSLKYYFELVPRRFGGQKYISRICSFTDYAPNTFNHIRKIFNIDNQEYINSIGPNKLMASLMMGQVNSLTALTSQGKSGSFFYYTADGKYMLKTIQYRQYKHLRSILQDYYHYLKNNPDTLITKFFGLHKLIQKDDKGDVIGKSYFVIMGNVFNTKQKIIERYDLKGSSYGRQTKDQRPGITKKDNNFRSTFRNGLNLDENERERLVNIIKKDAEFFRSHNIIDYSLLIGVIRKENQLSLMEQVDMNNSYKDCRQTKFYESTDGQFTYIVGIIDILTQYNSRKVMEYYFKKVIYGQGISAVPPDDYALRFTNFIESSVFKKVALKKK